MHAYFYEMKHINSHNYKPRKITLFMSFHYVILVDFMKETSGYK